MVLTDPAAIRARLAAARGVAVLGAHHEAHRPAFYVPEYLHRQGYTTLPVNPALAGQALWGQPVAASLGVWRGRFDAVDVFRRSDALPAHLPELLDACAPGTLVWLQSGVRHDAVAAALADAGLDVVQDRCMLADHRAWAIGPVG